MDKSRFILTNHAVDRLMERSKKFKIDISKQKISPSSEQAKLLAKKYFLNSEENKAILNNMSIIVRYQERYGFDKRYFFFVSDDVVFLGLQDQNLKCVIVTVLAREGFSSNHVKERKRF